MRAGVARAAVVLGLAVGPACGDDAKLVATACSSDGDCDRGDRCVDGVCERGDAGSQVTRRRDSGGASLLDTGIMVIDSGPCISAGCVDPSARLDEIALDAQALARDPARARVYATVAGAADRYPNRLVTIDADSGDIVDTVALGSEPGELAISDDGSTLWASLTGSLSIRRVDLTGELPAPCAERALPSTPLGDRTLASSLAVLPGTQSSVVAVLERPNTSYRFESVVVLDDGVPRPLSIDGGYGDVYLVAGPTGYVFALNSDDGAVHSLQVDDTGVIEVGSVDLVSSLGGSPGLAYGDGLLFASSGEVVDVSDPRAPFRTGTLAFTGPVASTEQGDGDALMVSPDDDFFARHVLLRRFETRTFSVTQTRTVTTRSGDYSSLHHLVRVRPGQIAFVAYAAQADTNGVYLYTNPEIVP